MIAGLYKIFDHWHTTGTVWLISDTHFDDKELYLGTQKAERANSEEYVKIINSKVGRKDTLIHLGDVGNIDYVSKLRAGRKILIMGNHDAGRTLYERNKYRLVLDADKYSKEEALMAAQIEYPNCRYTINFGYGFTAPFTYWEVIADNCLFDEVYEGALIIGEKLILSHEPVHVDWAMNIHGHVHDPHHQDNAHHLNICPDATGNFEPINFNRLMKSGFMSKIQTIHRETINRATERCRRKKGKK